MEEIEYNGVIYKPRLSDTNIPKEAAWIPYIESRGIGVSDAVKWSWGYKIAYYWDGQDVRSPLNVQTLKKIKEQQTQEKGE